MIMRLVFPSLLLLCLSTSVGHSQQPPPLHATTGDEKAAAGAFSEEGQLMPGLGKSQSAGNTRLDLKQERKSDKSMQICKGC